MKDTYSRNRNGGLFIIMRLHIPTDSVCLLCSGLCQRRSRKMYATGEIPITHAPKPVKVHHGLYYIYSHFNIFLFAKYKPMFSIDFPYVGSREKWAYQTLLSILPFKWQLFDIGTVYMSIFVFLAVLLCQQVRPPWCMSVFFLFFCDIPPFGQTHLFSLCHL